MQMNQHWVINRLIILGALLYVSDNILLLDFFNLYTPVKQSYGLMRVPCISHYHCW